VSEWIVPMAVSVLLQLLKTPVLAEKYKRALFKIWVEVSRQYASDPEFQKLASSDDGP